jgi:hypothetical protein
MEIIQGAMEYEDIEYCIADGGEKEREREREISIYLLHGRLSQCGMSPDIPNNMISPYPESFVVVIVS